MYKLFRSTLVSALLALAGVLANAHAAMQLQFDSSPGSWVGQGQSFSVVPEDGYLFSATRFDNAWSFMVASLNSPFGPDFDPLSDTPYHWWFLELAAPFGQRLAIGHYENTARWPFQAPDQPGMSFIGDHRGNNQETGFFDITDLRLDGQGNLSRIAVSFTQFGENNPDWWLTGRLLFNSPAAPVSEPPSLILLVLALGLIAAGAHRRRDADWAGYLQTANRASRNGLSWRRRKDRI